MNNYITYIGHKYYYLENDIQRPYARDLEWINDQLCIKGKLCHREDGPAIEYYYGDKDYFQYGKRHRIGGPAIEWCDGSKEYIEDGKRHREDGPAVEYSDGTIGYYLCDKYFKTKEELEQYQILQMLE